ncbi:MAG: hypothetical protein ABSE61_33180, partial [Bradyrhizobium sp.]
MTQAKEFKLMGGLASHVNYAKSVFFVLVASLVLIILATLLAEAGPCHETTYSRFPVSNRPEISSSPGCVALLNPSMTAR